MAALSYEPGMGAALVQGQRFTADQRATFTEALLGMQGPLEVELTALDNQRPLDAMAFLAERRPETLKDENLAEILTFLKEMSGKPKSALNTLPPR